MSVSGSTTAFNNLPYFDQYLTDILRPRAERKLETVRKTLNESVWQHLAKLLAAEQPQGDDASPAVIRALLEERLGLQIDVSVTARFADAPAGRPNDMPEVVVLESARRVASTQMPLVNAVIAETTNVDGAAPRTRR